MTIQTGHPTYSLTNSYQSSHGSSRNNMTHQTVNRSSSRLFDLVWRRKILIILTEWKAINIVTAWIAVVWVFTSCPRSYTGWTRLFRGTCASIFKVEGTGSERTQMWTNSWGPLVTLQPYQLRPSATTSDDRQHMPVQRQAYRYVVLPIFTFVVSCVCSEVSKERNASIEEVNESTISKTAFFMPSTRVGGDTGRPIHLTLVGDSTVQGDANAYLGNVCRFLSRNGCMDCKIRLAWIQSPGLSGRSSHSSITSSSSRALKNTFL